MKYGTVLSLACLMLLVFQVRPARCDTAGTDSIAVSGTFSEQNGAESEAESDTTGTSSLTGMLLPSLTRIGFSLLIIIGVIYVSVFVLRRLSGRRVGGRGARTIQVVEQAFLAPKKSICLLKLADRAVLVGITESNINLLTEMPWDQLPSDYVRKVDGKPDGFQGFLSEAAGKLFGSSKVKGAGDDSRA